MSSDRKKPDEKGPACGGVSDKPPIELLEKAVADMLDGEDIGACYWDRTLRGFRKALDAARRENIWDVVDLAFGNIVGVSYEMLLRSQLAMRLRLEHLTQRRGADHLPDVHEYAERIERVARFMLDSAVQYAKVRHVSSIVRRQGDPKIVDFGSAREKASREKTKAGDAENQKKAETAEA